MRAVGRISRAFHTVFLQKLLHKYISYSTAVDGVYFWCGGVGIGNKGREGGDVTLDHFLTFSLELQNNIGERASASGRTAI